MFEYKIVLIGPDGSGKTTYLHRFITGQFQKDYHPTVGCEVHPLTFKTSVGIVRLNCWDISGDDKFSALASEYSLEADGAIIFRNSSKPEKPSKIELASGIVKSNAKKVYVTNKCDRKDLKLANSGQVPLPFYLISAKSNYNFEKPFLSLLQQITGKPDLMLLD